MALHLAIPFQGLYFALSLSALTDLFTLWTMYLCLVQCNRSTPNQIPTNLPSCLYNLSASIILTGVQFPGTRLVQNLLFWIQTASPFTALNTQTASPAIMNFQSGQSFVSSADHSWVDHYGLDVKMNTCFPSYTSHWQNVYIILKRNYTF